MEDFAVLMLLGARVREVRNLAEGHVWLPEDRLLFIDSNLSPEERQCLSERLLVDSAEGVSP